MRLLFLCTIAIFCQFLVGDILHTTTVSRVCMAQNSLPDATCTPGQTFPNVTVQQICTPGYAGSVRNVPESTKNAVYAEYGVTTHKPGEYEIDHLVSLELGGSNDISNLWPEAAQPVPGYHEKDRVENYLHAQVCAGKLQLAEAQRGISTNWVKIYASIMH